MLDGKPFRFGGTNNYYLHYVDRADVDDLMDRAVAMGMQVIRTWAFFDVGSKDGSVPTLGNHDVASEIFLQYWDPVAKRPVLREEGLRGLDYVIAAAIGKPVLIEEFGLQDKTIRVTAYRTWLDAAREAGFAGWTVWMLAGTYLGQGLYPDRDGFTIHGGDAVREVLTDAALEMRTRP